MKTFEEMSVDELNTYIREEGNAIDARKEDLRKVCRMRDEKAAKAELAKKLAELSPAALGQLVSAGAIPSGEKVVGLAK